ncbi:hypothetical protein [Desulfopila sp. IMCC35008]|uniref:hypothetical protein n=1 Tax=Desulfopila sp. IMCC35008 TaxID=2653858 RepID=UPI0013D648B3|nr:hypothetical protein [Desulfopila sp. IMCC35008]
MTDKSNDSTTNEILWKQIEKAREDDLWVEIDLARKLNIPAQDVQESRKKDIFLKKYIELKQTAMKDSVVQKYKKALWMRDKIEDLPQDDQAGIDSYENNVERYDGRIEEAEKIIFQSNNNNLASVNHETSDNYFIRSGEYWRIRFQGQKEIYMNHQLGFGIIADFLNNRDVELNRSEVCRSWKGVTSPVLSTEQAISEGQDSIDNRDPHGGGDRVDEKITQKGKEKIKENVQGILGQINRLQQEGKSEKALVKSEELERVGLVLKKEYGAYLDTDTGSIRWVYNTERNPKNNTESNAQRAIKRAIEVLKKEAYTDLADHLTRYLLKRVNVYSPPHDFPDWYISI